MPQPKASIDYSKCHPDQCNNGTCIAATECPNKVLQQEAAGEFPFSHPSHYCRGCAKCAQACPFGAVSVK